MPNKYRSSITTSGRNMSGARALWRATGMTDDDFGKMIVAVVNSFSQFVPGHIHLRDIGQLVSKEIYACGGVAKEFNTIAIDDGIAMGHSGMLYSLPSRDLIADSIEYMINAHCADAMVCISNCDKITPGMLMASLRLNIPTVFVSGGPMESGRVDLFNKETTKLSLVDAIVYGADSTISDSDSSYIENFSCPTCGSCSGMFTANSMNCLLEALGLAQPGNGSLLATHYDRKQLFLDAAKCIVKLTKSFYKDGDASVLPRNIANKLAFENAMILDIAMGGSTNTVLHLLAAAQEGEIDFSMSDVDRLSKNVPYLCKIAPNTNKYYMEDVHRAGGVMGVLGELNRANFLNRDVYNVLGKTLTEMLKDYDIMTSDNILVKSMYSAAPAGIRTTEAFSQQCRWSLDTDRRYGCIRSCEYAYSQYGGLAVLYGNLALNGCLIKTAGILVDMHNFSGIAKVYESQEEAANGILSGEILPGTVVVIRYEGPQGGPGMQEMLYPTAFLKSMKLDQSCGLITDGRFSGGTSGLSIGHISPEAANGGLIGLIYDGDIIDINVSKNSLYLNVSKSELESRRNIELARMSRAWTPRNRNRSISFALKAYAQLVSGADKGAIRDKSKFL